MVMTHSPGNTSIKETLADIKAKGHDFHAYPVDVADYDSCAALRRAGAAKDVGAVDILINNAGITRDMTFRKMGKADWDTVIRTNLDSMFNMTKPVVDGMVERGWGRIINVCSVNGSKGAFGQTNYAAAKAGMHGFTKALALEVAKKGVTVNTISPGYIGTKMVMAIPKEVLGLEDHPADSRGPARQARRGRRPHHLSRARTRRRSSPAPTSPSTAASTCSDVAPIPARHGQSWPPLDLSPGTRDRRSRTVGGVPMTRVRRSSGGTLRVRDGGAARRGMQLCRPDPGRGPARWRGPARRR